MKSIKAFIFARGGSKGLPNKNILPIEGLTLVERAILVAKSMHEIDQIFLSTDSKKIAEVAERYDIELINRPSFLASDNSPEWYSWQHAIKHVQKKYGEFDCFLSLPPTSPLRIKNDVQRTINALKENVDLVITMSEARRNPWFNMVIKDKGGKLRLIGESSEIFHRQKAPICFDISTVAYAALPNYVLRSDNMWSGNVNGIVIPQERSIDIDNEFDFNLAKILIKDEIFKNQSNNS